MAQDLATLLPIGGALAVAEPLVVRNFFGSNSTANLCEPKPLGRKNGGFDSRKLLHFPDLIKGMYPIAQHQNAENKGRDDAEVRDLSKIQIVAKLLISVEGDDDSDHEKQHPHRLKEQGSKRPDQISKGVQQ
jgi:hypothetical protein